MLERYVIILEKGCYASDLKGNSTIDIEDAYLFINLEEAKKELSEYDCDVNAIIAKVICVEEKIIKKTIYIDKYCYLKGSE